MSVFNNNLLLGAGGQGGGDFDTGLIPNSVWLDGSADFLKRTFASGGNQKRFVLGTWIQRNSISSSTIQNVFATGADGSNGFFFTYQNATSSRDDRINIYNISGGSLDWNIQTSARFRDIAYYHILLSYESAASTSTDRVQIFINGVLQTSLETASFPSSGFDCDWGAAQSHCIGNNDHNTAVPLPAYLAQTIYLDGKSIQNSDVAVTDFLEAFSYGTNGSQFGPKANADVAALASTAGGNSFCLNYENSVFLGQDSSNNSETNIALGQTGLKSDDLGTGAASLLTDGTQFGSWNAGSGLVYQNSAVTTKSWWGVDFGADGVAVTKAILSGNASGDASSAGFTQDSISDVTFTLFGSDSAQATSNNDLSSLTTVGSVVVSNTQTKGVTATINAPSNTTEFRFYYVQMNTAESTRRLLAEIELFTVGNSFTTTSMTSANQSTNTPSLVFPVLNAIDSDPTLAASLGFGNRLGVGVSDWDSVFSTLPMGKTGKWYFEVRLHTDTGSNGFIAGIHDTTTTSRNFANYIGNTTATFGLGYSLYTHSGNVYTNGGTTASGGSTLAAGDVVMMAVDLDNNKLWYGENGTFYTNSSGAGNPATGANPSIALQADTEYVFGTSPSSSEDYFVNFGADSTFGGAVSAGSNADANGFGDFKHAPPSGYLCLCSANLTTPEAQGVDNFAVTLAQEGSLFSAMGTAEADFTGSGTVRIYKSRTSGSGAESWGYSFSHDATKEYVLPSLNGAMTHGSLRTLSGTDNWAGYSIGIAEDAGTAMGVQAHSNGSDTTITHGLTTSRCIILLFNRSGGDILYFHPDIASGTLLKLNNSVLPFSSTIITDVTTTTFDIGAAAGSATYDYLVLAETPGMTDIFSYTGNSNANGPFIALNARPEFLVAKLTTTHATEHFLLDKARYPFNGPNMPLLMPNQIAAEGAFASFNADFLASSLKIRNTSTDMNFNGGVFVGWTFGSIAGNGTLPPTYGQ